MYPSAAAKGDEDIESYLRMVAKQEGLDPNEVMAEGRHTMARRNASAEKTSG